ncbi:MAG TPA: hypothetical protein VN738_11270, partial [Acidothermaceae bacterium]|nr:hypothetical protein [Acidothermaceae bacterium]
MPLLSNASKQGSLKGDYGTGHSSSAPATWYLAFFTDKTLTTELTQTGGIPRIAIANDDAHWSTSASGVTTNVLAIVSATSSGAWSQAPGYAALMDASTGGNAWDGAAVSGVSVDAAGLALSIGPGEFAV